MLKKEVKQAIIKKFATSPNDTGSCQVQIALISQRIREISTHLQAFPKDNHSRRGLLCLVGQRKAFMKYLKQHDHAGFNAMMDSLKQAELV